MPERAAQWTRNTDLDTGAVISTDISDRYGLYYMRVISAMMSEATFVLDGLVHHVHQTDFRITEHCTDTAGATGLVFGLCHLLGYRFAPRIKDLAAGVGNALSRALRALGRIERTLFTLPWLSDPALRRAMFYHRQGEIRDRTSEKQAFMRPASASLQQRSLIGT